MLNFHSVGQENDGGAGSVGLADATLHQDPPEEEEHGESEKLQSLTGFNLTDFFSIFSLPSLKLQFPVQNPLGPPCSGFILPSKKNRLLTIPTQ